MKQKYWAAKEKPHELRGIILEEDNQYIHLSSFLLGKKEFNHTFLFKEKCVTYELDIPQTLVYAAERCQCPISFDPTKQHEQKFSLKSYIHSQSKEV